MNNEKLTDCVNNLSILLFECLNEEGMYHDIPKFKIVSNEDFKRTIRYLNSFLTLQVDDILEYWKYEEDYKAKQGWIKDDLEFIEKYKINI